MGSSYEDIIQFVLTECIKNQITIPSKKDDIFAQLEQNINSQKSVDLVCILCRAKIIFHIRDCIIS